ncbi:MAG TPA: hydrogenase 3 maturation endopeptidase HyCI [Syntrophomonadaceae bacterium]|nr:hydrogenase 3 maturation endopeptidase HyCI [Syntrophomonadaceae bacterium]
MFSELVKRLKGRIVILGIGNSMRGDDAAGPILLEKLKGTVNAELIDTGEVPESYLGRIINSKPNTIVLIDAVNIGLQPGSAALIEISQLDDFSNNTHRMTLGIFARFLQTETSADVFLVGIQPASTILGDKMSTQVENTIDCLKEAFIKKLGWGNT